MTEKFLSKTTLEDFGVSEENKATSIENHSASNEKHNDTFKSSRFNN